MRKDTVYKIYELLDDPQIVTDNLKELLILDNRSGETLYELIKANKYIVDGNNIKELIDLSYSINTIESVQSKKQLTENIKEMFINDYVCNDSNFNEAISTINYLLNYEYWEDFDLEENSDLDFYKTLTVNNLISIITSISNVDIDNIYSHNLSFILDNYAKLIHDIKQTETSNKDLTNNDMKIKRIEYYTNILSNSDIILLNNKKFNSLVKIAGSICNIERLKKFENIVLFNRTKSNSEFEEEIDNYCDELTGITIDRINKKLKIQKVYDEEKDVMLYMRSNYDDEYELNLVKKILKPNKKY